MKKYDDYKTQTPEEERSYECTECGTPIDQPGTCDSRACFEASML